MRVLTAGTARAYIHDLLPPRPLSGRPATPETPFILLILSTVGLKFFVIPSGERTRTPAVAFAAGITPSRLVKEDALIVFVGVT